MTAFFVGLGIGFVATLIAAFLVIRNNRERFASAMDAAQKKIAELRKG